VRLASGATSVPADAFLIDDGHEHVHYQGSWSAMVSTTRTLVKFIHVNGLVETWTPADLLLRWSTAYYDDSWVKPQFLVQRYLCVVLLRQARPERLGYD
jgi:hypothetical protein